jgi:hypothetical protein
MRPYATSVRGLELLVYEALKLPVYEALKLPVYEALSYECMRP